MKIGHNVLDVQFGQDYDIIVSLRAHWFPCFVVESEGKARIFSHFCTLLHISLFELSLTLETYLFKFTNEDVLSLFSSHH